MTPAQRILARRALGLGIVWDRSTQNAFKTLRHGAEFDDWRRMVAEGEAFEVSAQGAFVTFAMTRAGAERALDPGDTLDPEHFPSIHQD